MKQDRYRNSKSYVECLDETAAYLAERYGRSPSSAWVFGSGLGSFLDDLNHEESISFSEIPHFPVTTVEGHRSRLILLEVEEQVVVCLAGRIHLYEGWSAGEVVFAVRVLSRWGCRDFFLANAAGAINADFQPGQLMLICDHLNLTGANPLIGDDLESLGDRFPDMSQVYCRDLRAAARECAEQVNLVLRQGIYAAVSGPSYETPAEVRMLRRLGADAVGMSTVPEAIALRHMGRRVLGLSCLTNMAAGTLSRELSHSEVLQEAARIQGDLSKFFLSLARNHSRMKREKGNAPE